MHNVVASNTSCWIWLPCPSCRGEVTRLLVTQDARKTSTDHHFAFVYHKPNGVLKRAYRCVRSQVMLAMERI